MQYFDGTPVKLLDVVSLAESLGRVVCLPGQDQYAENYPKSDWRYLNRGVLIDFEEFGPIYYDEEPEEDIRFVRRQL